MAEWQNNYFPEFLPSATRKPPELKSATKGPPKYESLPDMYFNVTPQRCWRFLRSDLIFYCVHDTRERENVLKHSHCIFTSNIPSSSMTTESISDNE